MTPKTVASRLAWSFAALFVLGLLLVSGFAYFELVIEPKMAPEEHETMAEAILEIAAEAVIPVALIALMGWWLARRAVHPLQTLANAANRIHEGNLHERIELPGSAVEFLQLADVMNAMTARLNESFQRIRQFTLYASHELKTPLSVLHCEFERLTDDPARSESDRAAFARNLDEIERLSRMVDGLTFLTKADSQLVPLTWEPVCLHDLVTAAAEDTEVLGAERGIRVTLERCEKITVEGDRHRLRQLLVILCDNAIKYNRPHGGVEISLEARGPLAVFTITNTGPAIPPEEQARVFERFYRGSNVKADGIEGTGLGLSIAHWIASAHHGSLTFSSQPDRTSFVFQMRLAPHTPAP